MKKRIYKDFLGLVFLSTVVLSALLSLFFYTAFKNRVFADLRETTQLAADIMNSTYAAYPANPEGPSVDALLTDNILFIGDKADALRITVIAHDGTVLFDNKIVASTLENHADRIEFIDAINTGTGETTRLSTTQMTETYYYAVLLDDGNVLRLSRTTEGVTGIFLSLLPVIILVTASILLLANSLAKRLAKSIIDPLEAIDFESDDQGESLAAYDELVPYAKRINRQRQEITRQLTVLQNRADTISVITNNMREGLLLLDDSGKVMTANKSALAIFGESQDGAIETDILHLCRDIDFQQGVKDCLVGNNSEIVFESNGRSYAVHFSPVRSTNEIIGGVVLFFDITEHRDAERSRREFTANVSHELKTPLTLISALSEIISTGMAKAEDIQGFADKISEQTRRLINIIDDILKLSEFDEDRKTKDFSTFDLYELSLLVIDALKSQAEKKDLSVKLVGQHLNITANRQMIDELLFNLLDNAIKYNRTGGSVTVELSLDDTYYQIAISDTGVGIPLEQQSRVFERFYRVDGSRSKKTGGSGLGLSIVKHIVEYHGGHVELESTVGIGTTVTCYIIKRSPPKITPEIPR